MNVHPFVFSALLIAAAALGAAIFYETPKPASEPPRVHAPAPKRTPYSDCKAQCAPCSVLAWGTMPDGHYGHMVSPVCLCNGCGQ